jgi:hypothetical protein
VADAEGVQEKADPDFQWVLDTWVVFRRGIRS